MLSGSSAMKWRVLERPDAERMLGPGAARPRLVFFHGGFEVGCIWACRGYALGEIQHILFTRYWGIPTPGRSSRLTSGSGEGLPAALRLGGGGPWSRQNRIVRSCAGLRPKREVARSKANP